MMANIKYFFVITVSERDLLTKEIRNERIILVKIFCPLYRESYYSHLVCFAEQSMCATSVDNDCVRYLQTMR